jgi:hypothetical protein
MCRNNKANGYVISARFLNNLLVVKGIIIAAAVIFDVLRRKGTGSAGDKKTIALLPPAMISP